MTAPAMSAGQKGPVPPLIFLGALIIEAILGTRSWAQFIAPPWNYSGIVFIAAGVGLVIWGNLQFRRADTPVHPFEQPTALVTSGPFRATRNPMYLGMTLVLLGAAILFGKLIPLVMPFVFASVISKRFIRHEETRMETLFGDAYVDYMRRVRRWL
jgi:protein-S-isoprenylcysteine O-methyltransferase Ste14